MSASLDSLEPRRLFAASVSLSGTGTLRITGTSGDDRIELQHVKRNDSYIVKLNDGTDGGRQDFNSDKVKRILIDVGDGNDRVSIGAGVDERATVLGGNGRDRIDAFGFAAVSLNGGAGDDTIRHAIDFDPYEGTPGPDDDVWGVGELRGMYLDMHGDDAVNYVSNCVLMGGSGNDTIYAAGKGDRVDGGKGDDDRLILTAGVAAKPGSAAVPPPYRVISGSGENQLVEIVRLDFKVNFARIDSVLSASL